jgi:His-Xaa-Ser system protein HxsD
MPSGPVEVTLDAAAYTADALQRAAYRMLASVTFELLRRDAVFVCRLYPRPGTASDGLADEFRSCALDEVLRARIREETADVRNFVLSLAFSRTGLVPAPPN